MLAFFNSIKYYVYLCGFVYVSAVRALAPLELVLGSYELPGIVPGNQTPILCKSSLCS